MNRRPAPLLAFLLGALSVGALGMAVHDDRAIQVTRAFVTAHIGDTLVNRVTTSIDSVSVSLARPPGYPSRVWLPRCGTTKKFSRDWIGTRVVAAETTFVTVTGTTTECANPPAIPRDTSRVSTCGSSADSTQEAALLPFIRPCLVDSAASVPNFRTTACQWQIIRDSTIACLAFPKPP